MAIANMERNGCLWLLSVLVACLLIMTGMGSAISTARADDGVVLEVLQPDLDGVAAMRDSSFYPGVTYEEYPVVVGVGFEGKMSMFYMTRKKGVAGIGTTFDRVLMMGIAAYTLGRPITLMRKDGALVGVLMADWDDWGARE
jgi:hypothetical protein